MLSKRADYQSSHAHIVVLILVLMEYALEGKFLR